MYKRMLDEYKMCFPEEEEKIGLLTDFIQENVDHIYDRKNMNGHITASGLVMRDGKVLVIKHPYTGLTLLPGGHVEIDETPEKAAIRETLEETGIKCAFGDTHLIDIDIHLIPDNSKKGEQKHLHYDLCFVLKEDGKIDKYELETNWILPEEITNDRLKRCIDKAKKLR